jgi:hypothetical protein
MATLGSPGVQVQVIDESFYTPAAPGTVPIIFIATAQDKSNASATGTAQGTTAANAGKVWVITSQRDLTDTFGTPTFYTDASGNSKHGYELNEYGLQAAYSLLGATSRAYVVRADIDLAQLAGSSSVPSGTPVSNTYWMNTSNSLYGIYEWNSTTLKFTNKLPLIIDSSNFDANVVVESNVAVPKTTFGSLGDYAIVFDQSSVAKLWYKNSSGTWISVQNGFDTNKTVVVAPHTSYPTWNASTPNGSVWLKSTPQAKGASWEVKNYNASTKSWSTLPAPIYASTAEALLKYDYTGGGVNIPVGTLFVDANTENQNSTVNFKVWRRASSGKTVVSSITTINSTFSAGYVLSIKETLAGGGWSSIRNINVDFQVGVPYAQTVAAAINNSPALVNVKASYDSVTGAFSIYHNLGGDFELSDNGSNVTLVTVGLVSTQNEIISKNLYVAPTGDGFAFLASNWKPLDIVASSTEPTNSPDNGQLWFDTSVSDVDIMVHDGVSWKGYRTVYPATDPAGPIVAALEPGMGSRSDGNDPVDGDIWISTANPDNYGKEIYVYSSGKWILQDVSDQDTPDGWLFADARWATTGGSSNPSSIKSLLTSNYVDPDAPDPALYPRGMKLWNTRRSGNNVKKYIAGYININANNGLNIRYDNQSMDNYVTGRWVSQSTRNEDGSGKFGRFAQRGFVVESLKSLIDTNQAVRDTDTLVFNLLATPGYPEVIQNMITLNADRGYTGFVVGDTPFRLPANGTALNNWGTNAGLAFDNGESGAVSFDDYGCMAMFYPSGYTTDNLGNNIVVPPSHMMLRTIINSDAKSYQWFAPAGIRRGGVDNVTSVGYIDANSGEFKTAAIYESLRSVLQSPTVKINPIATIPGVGIVNFGQMTRSRSSSSLDRINVARLVAYLRRQLSILARPFLFEPNDEQTRREIKAAADSLMLELVGQRALYDFVTVCDTTNNTPARIDRSELWLDIAIEPVKAVEFIYIPLRIKKTGSIAAGL